MCIVPSVDTRKHIVLDCLDNLFLPSDPVVVKFITVSPCFRKPKVALCYGLDWMCVDIWTGWKFCTLQFSSASWDSHCRLRIRGRYISQHSLLLQRTSSTSRPHLQISLCLVFHHRVLIYVQLYCMKPIPGKRSYISSIFRAANTKTDTPASCICRPSLFRLNERSSPDISGSAGRVSIEY